MAFSSSNTSRVVIVTNIPAPYRNPVYQRLSEMLGYNNLHVVFCAKREGNREWIIEQQGFAHTFLKEQSTEYKGRYIHNNLEVIKVLRQLKPDIVVTSGFNPTHLYAFAYALLARKIHVPMTDGTVVSERHLSIVHRGIRHLVYRFSKVFVGASNGSARLYADYGVKPESFFQSHLCANNDAFTACLDEPRRYDFMFCGRFSPEKNPLFALDVCAGVARSLGRKVSILLVGSGPMLEEVRTYAASLGAEVDCSFSGFVQQADLPRLYCSTKVFLFPSSWDPWGVVANEACAAGLAVMVSPLAGVADQLIVNESNGYVLPLSLPLWIARGENLLRDEGLLAQFSANSRLRAKLFTYEAAALGLASAMRTAAGPNHLHQETQVYSQPQRRVVIVQRRLTNYRVPLFELMRTKLAASGVDLMVVYGDPTEAERCKGDAGSLSWGKYQACTYWLNNRLCWQNISQPIRGTDLVIVTQENKLLYNLRLLFSRRRFKLAFWGHGANLQSSNRQSILGRWKSWTTNRVDAWFAYTGLSVKLVANNGFMPARISNLENAIDTKSLALDLELVTADDLLNLRRQLDIGEGPVGLYLGSLYGEKRIDFMLEAARRIAERVPGFRMVVIGNGPERSKVEVAFSQYSWMRFPGSMHGRDKALYLRLADIFLNPGMVGLTILDSFVAGVAMVTTDCGIHSPEIDYLVNGENGLMTENTIEAYVEAVTQLLRNKEQLALLCKGAKQSAAHYSIENMADNFSHGILKVLGEPCVS
jgi:glycosyltransferase involved in cell wall biosynthesis